MKHLKKFNESIIDMDAYDIMLTSKSFKRLLKGDYENEDEFLDNIEIELKELDFGDTDVIRAAETIYRENE